MNMTKDEIKLLCETDDKLQWWAMVLFAEISALVNSQKDIDEDICTFIRMKVDEFPRLVVCRSLEKAKDVTVPEAR